MRTNCVEIIVSDMDDFTTNLLNELLDDGQYDSGVRILAVDDEHIKYCAYEWYDRIVYYINEEFIDDEEVREEFSECTDKDASILDEYQTWGFDYQGCAVCYIDEDEGE